MITDLQVAHRLIECGIFQRMNPEAIQKLKAGEVHVIDCRGPVQDEIGWLEPAPNGKQVWRPKRPTL